MVVDVMKMLIFALFAQCLICCHRTEKHSLEEKLFGHMKMVLSAVAEHEEQTGALPKSLQNVPNSKPWTDEYRNIGYVVVHIGNEEVGLVFATVADYPNVFVCFELEGSRTFGYMSADNFKALKRDGILKQDAITMKSDNP